MKCPKCNKPIDLIPPAERNVEIYNRHSLVLATSQCCGVAFKVSMTQKFHYELYTGEKTKDDWGNEIKKL